MARSCLALAILAFAAAAAATTAPLGSFRHYDEDLALVAMAYAHSAYGDVPYPADFHLIGNVTREYAPQNFGATNTILGLVGYSSDLGAVVVGFRGTEDVEQLVSELAHALLYDGPYSTEWTNAFSDDAKALSYFYEAYQTIRDKMRTLVSKAVKEYPGTDMLFTGHSLGGALATLSLIDIYLNRHHIFHQAATISLHTFGQPRVGNKQLALGVDTVFNSTAYYRLINNEDIVPHLPPANIESYLHSGIEVWYPGKLYKSKVMCGKYVCGDIFTSSGKLQEDPSCSNSLLLHASIEDHLHYWDALDDGFCGNGTASEPAQNQYARYLAKYLSVAGEEERDGRERESSRHRHH